MDPGQVVAHLVKDYNASSSANQVDGDPVPVPHFGIALPVNEFQELAERLRLKGVQFLIEPHIRFVGQPGEQWTMFFKDPSGNSLVSPREWKQYGESWGFLRRCKNTINMYGMFLLWMV